MKMLKFLSFSNANMVCDWVNNNQHRKITIQQIVVRDNYYVVYFWEEE